MVCRDDARCFQGTFTVVFEGVTDPVTHEAHVYREAVALAEDLHLHRVRIAFDYLKVVNEPQDSLFLDQYRMDIKT